MTKKRVQLSQIVKSQFPSYVREDFPLISEFLSKYYTGQEYQGGPIDLINNIDSYVKLIANDGVVKSTTLPYSLDQSRSETIFVQNTDGFPDTYGLIRIDDEIILYESKEDTYFKNCTRGFSGVTSFENSSDPENLVFSTSEAVAHEFGATVENLSVLFLEQFLSKTKNQLLNGLEQKELTSELNQVQFIRNSKDFYSSRGTDESFRILFKALYGVDADIIRPIDSVIAPSSANYRKTRDLIVEPISGDPNNLLNRTLFQDTFENIQKSYAPVSAVEKIYSGVSTAQYYRVSIDGSLNQNDGSTELLYGNFSSHPKTYIIGSVGVGQSYLDVDSTVGFPNSGTLSFQYTDGTVGVCTYLDRTINQFLGINTTGIEKQISDKTPIDQNTYAYASFGDDSEGIKIKIRSVLTDLKVPQTTYYQKKGSKVKINSLGKVSSLKKSNNWLFNTAQYYDAVKVTLLDSSNNIYKFQSKDQHILVIGDTVKLTTDAGVVLSNSFSIVDVFDENNFLFRGTGISDPNDIVKATREITKVDSDIHPNLNKITANVQNVYLKPDRGLVDGKVYKGLYHEHPETGIRMVGAVHASTPHKYITDDPNSEKILVASSSLPADASVKLNAKIQRFSFTGTFTANTTDIQIVTGVDHNFFTGDAVYYTPEIGSVTTVDSEGNSVFQEYVISQLFDEGIYFVKRVDANTIKLAKSRANINAGIFEEIDGKGFNTVSVTSNTIEKYIIHDKEIKPQKLFREIKEPISDGHDHETVPGYTGMMINGVEVLNYKSLDHCYYGEINSIQVTSGGKNYDVINPPELSVTDSVGFGATGFCAVEGIFEDIKIVDPGFDYLETPIIKITGGNGTGATAEAKLSTVPHEVTFDASGIGSARIGVDTSRIGFSTTHKFRNGERVVYKTFGKKALSGLTTGSSYYVNVKDNYTITLHKNLSEASVGINTIPFTDFGSGIQAFSSFNGKKIVSSIVLTNSGSGYKNQKVSCLSAGINTSLNEIIIPNHGYNSGEIVKYTVDGTAPNGLVNATEYYVTTIDDNSFKLSVVGSGSTVEKDFYYRTKQYTDLTSIGVGTHFFNYQDIVVNISGTIGISSIEGKTFEAQTQPIVRGEIKSIHLSNSGEQYGSSDILNFERLPQITLNSGRNSEITPVISDGKIIDVIIGAAGTDYNSPPNLVISGVGTGAELVPQLNSSGNIIGVTISKTGAGYGTSTTSIRVVESGKDCLLAPTIQRWTVNEFRKNLANINDDDVIVSDPTNNSDGLQCSYVYAPRNLRRVSYANDPNGRTLYGVKDLRLVGGVEQTNSSHSPIIGWSYDGHPIYGPYAYSSKTGGSITQMRSGYVLNLKSNRPPTSEFPPEFFVEDFLWLESTDDAVLDENNGRFCVTPEYPDGVYAYFSTNEFSPSSDGVFKNFKKPVFPYLIGNSYNSKPNEFNFKSSSNQASIDLNSTTWIRNSYPYSLNSVDSGYEYVKQSYLDVNQDATISVVEKGSIDSLGILTGGQNYQVGDKIIFSSETQSNNIAASASVTKVFGSGIGTISVNTTTLSNVEFYSIAEGAFVGIHSVTHGLDNNDIVQITGLTTSSSLLNQAINVGINTTKLSLGSSIGDISTGIVTFLSVVGDIINVKENDVFKIEDENVKVLNVDRISSRLRVLRQENSTIAAAHTSSTILEELPRKLSFSYSGIHTSFNTKINREYYFNPAESVGVGSTGVGIGVTLSISNPGSGSSEIFVPIQSIYLPNHGLQTGDEVTYQTNTGTSIGISTNEVAAGFGSTSLLNQNSILFVANISQDFIGLSTVRIGLGTLGTFVGVGTSISHQGLVYFTGIGTGEYHSLKTTYPTVKGNVQKNTVVVSTATSHGLTNDDTVTVSVNPTNVVSTKIIYNKFNRRPISTGLAFTSGGITTSTSASGVLDSINLNDHGLKTGDEIIHISENSSGGLVNNKKYFVYVVSKDVVKLTENKYQIGKTFPSFVGITTAGSGEIFPVNPTIKAYRNSFINFTLDDSTLAYTQNATSYPAFEFKFYTDSNFENEYLTDGSLNDNETFDVTQTGTIGISSGAKVTLRVKENTPKVLYYKLSPILDLNNPIVNREIENTNGKLLIENSGYNGNHQVTVTSSNTFQYELGFVPESSSYTDPPAKLSYETTSTSAYGPISQVRFGSRGKGYVNIPGISTIQSSLGSGAILEPSSKTIGKVRKISVSNIGFDYPVDKTLKPSANLPQILKVEPLTGFESIGVTSLGRGYNTAPSLVVIDGRTKKQIRDVDLRYTIGKNTVTILENTNSLSNTEPTIIPVGNPNGIRASNFEYDSTTQKVTVTLKDAYSTSDTFPLVVGDKVLIENVSVGVGSTAIGYNSENYDYSRFEITEVFQNLSSVGVVTYSLANYLVSGETPGRFDAINSSATLVRERDFIQFSSTLKSNIFQEDEVLTNGSNEGTVFEWDSDTKYLTIESRNEFNLGDILVSDQTGNKGIIREKVSAQTSYELDYSSIVDNGWEYDKGFLNKESQRLHDNEYYQSFSYSIKSKIQYDEWKDVVSKLNHAAGFVKFSNLDVESQLPQVSETTLRPVPDQQVSSIIDLIGNESLNCVPNFDLVSENYLKGTNRNYSDEINFSSRLLTDFAESVSNRVLTIDDISDQFNNNPRTTPYADVFRQRLSDGRAQKFIAYVKDRLFTGERQIFLINGLHDSGRGFSMINQYGVVETVLDLGSFDYSIEGTESVLRFYPHKYTVNNYNVVLLSYNIDQATLGITTDFVSIGSTVIGESTDFTGSLVSIASSTVEIAGGSTDTIVTLVGVGTTTPGVRSAKVLASVEDSDGNVEYDEVIFVHDGTNVQLMEYGQLTIHSTDAASSTGNIGTFGASIASDGIFTLTYTPNAGITTATVSTITVGMATENYTGIGTYELTYSSLEAKTTSIASTTSPFAVGIASYADVYDAAYCFVQVSDTTNGRYEVSEVVIIDDYDDSSPDNVLITEFANTQVGSGAFVGLGTISARRAGDGSNYTEITFTPDAGADIEVKTFMNALRPEENTSVSPGGRSTGEESTIFFGDNATITNGLGFYEGTQNTIKKQFNLQHKTIDIFRRAIDGSSTLEVDLSNDSIKLPNHFFVTGQEVVYAPSTGVATHAIGIGTTTFAGIGATDLLPLHTSVFVIKQNDNSFKLARSAEDALKKIAIPLDLTSVGIGTSHSFTAKDQNQKVLISIDNVIQSPIAGTSVTTSLARSTTIGDEIIYFSGITSFFGADYVRVGAADTGEIMKIIGVGIGSTNGIKVQRQWLGTPLSAHSSGSRVEKIRGHYNIVENSINFVEAPIGKNPISSSTNPPDSRDWEGITTSSSFNGRVFTRSGVINGTEETYADNYLYDDISQLFDAQTKQFSLTVDGANITGVSTNNAILLINSIFQEPGNTNNYSLSEVSGITSVTFTGTATSVAYDPNNANIPVGGVIVSVGSSSGFGYQPLVAAGGTAVVSASGTITSIAIGNTGSGYRSGIQTVNVGVGTSSRRTANIEFIGTAAVSGGHIVSVAVTNPGIGYTRSNPPYVFFDSPLSYDNIPLEYSSDSPGTGGVQAKVDIVVGQGSSVIAFNVSQLGYGYGINHVLTVPVGGTTGIPTDPTAAFEEFKLTVQETDNDAFTAWSVGQLQVLDDFSNLFDGGRKDFPITLNGNAFSIQAAKGSPVSVQDTLLIFINDILQVPVESYFFNGGSTITFEEAPKNGDTLKMIFYRGTGGVDVVDREVIDTVKVGDDLTIGYDVDLKQNPLNIQQTKFLQENTRTVVEVTSSSSVDTPAYSDAGVDSNTRMLRPVVWCRQTEDRFIGGVRVSKARELYDARIFPTAYLTRSVGVGSTIVYVDNVRPFFNPANENAVSTEFQKEIVFIDKPELVSAAATAIIGTGTTVISIDITEGGKGYTSAPTVSIQNPVGLGTTARATATATITNGSVTSITISNDGGTGYAQTTHPLVLITPPTFVTETNTVDSFAGDFGIITGIGTTSLAGVASTGIVLDLVIPQNSFLRDPDITQPSAITVSGITTGDLFVIRNSNVGNGLTSLDENNAVVGVGTSFMDGVYRVAHFTAGVTTDAIGFGQTTLTQVVVSVSSIDGLTGLGFSNFYGEYSWGKLSITDRNKLQSYTVNTENGITGIETGPIVNRVKSMKVKSYSV